MASFAMRGRVAILRIAKPPINSLGLAVRQGLACGLDEAEAAGAKAVVIAGEGATFPAGADITEFAAGGHLTKPTLNDIIERISALPMHSVAAIHGTALGGGMEVTLACTHRLVHEGAKLGLPEVHLGILPGAGGTQRLPRLVGCETAIQMMTSGAPIGAKAALAAQLCDETVPADAAAPADTVLEAAVAYAEQHLVDAPWDPSRVVANRKLEDPGADVRLRDEPGQRFASVAACAAGSCCGDFHCMGASDPAPAVLHRRETGRRSKGQGRGVNPTPPTCTQSGSTCTDTCTPRTTPCRRRTPACRCIRGCCARRRL
jgi:enoyl-CoA hydratase/carnithine racemase